MTLQVRHQTKPRWARKGSTYHDGCSPWFAKNGPLKCSMRNWWGTTTFLLGQTLCPRLRPCFVDTQSLPSSIRGASLVAVEEVWTLPNSNGVLDSLHQFIPRYARWPTLPSNSLPLKMPRSGMSHIYDHFLNVSNTILSAPVAPVLWRKRSLPLTEGHRWAKLCRSKWV